MAIQKRILAAVNEEGEIGTSEYGGETFVVEITDNGGLENALSKLKTDIKDDDGADIDDYVFVEYVAVTQYVSEPKWIDVR